jgi:VanZ family protein
LYTDPDKHSKKFIYAALIFYWLILFAATSLPTSSLPDVGGGDKIKHFGAYMVLTILLTLTIMVQDKSRFLKKHVYAVSIAIAVIYGILDELHQALIPGRSCEFMDWVADFGGAVTGALIIYFYSRINTKYQKRG